MQRNTGGSSRNVSRRARRRDYAALDPAYIPMSSAELASNMAQLAREWSQS